MHTIGASEPDQLYPYSYTPKLLFAHVQEGIDDELSSMPLLYDVVEAHAMVYIELE